MSAGSTGRRVSRSVSHSVSRSVSRVGQVRSVSRFGKVRSVDQVRALPKVLIGLPYLDNTDANDANDANANADANDENFGERMYLLEVRYLGKE